MEVSPRRGSTVHPFFFYRILLSNLAINCEEVQWGSSKITVYQGAKKVIFTACQSGKLKLPFTCPNIISTSPQIFWWAELTSHFFCKLNSSKYFTCPLGKLRTEFTSPIAKSTNPRLSDATFFASWEELQKYARHIAGWKLSTFLRSFHKRKHLFISLWNRAKWMKFRRMSTRRKAC